MALTLTTKGTDGAVCVIVSGEVDVSNADELRLALDNALATAEGSVEVDLSETSYIDSTGIGVLVGSAHHADEAGLAFAVTNPQRNVARVLSLLGVDDKLGVRS